MSKDFEFDPVKREKGGKEAEAVVWSVSVLNKAVDAMRKGLPLKANPFIGKNTKLLKPDLVFKRTQEEIDDYIHCMEDPLYFATKCYLMTPTGLEPVVLRDYQEDYIKHLQKNRFSLFLSCRQSGKTLTFINKITISISSSLLTTCKNNHLDYILKNYYFYIDKDQYFIEIPLFELQNLYDDSFLWKLKYYLYKSIYKLKEWESRKSTQKTARGIMSTIRRIFQKRQ